MPHSFQPLKDYYAILGVPKTASQEEIKAAYRNLAKTWHPDVCKRPDAHERFIEIAEAYEILGKPDLRREYDTLASSKRYSSSPISQNQPGYEGFAQRASQARSRAQEYSTWTLDEVLAEIVAATLETTRTIIYGDRLASVNLFVIGLKLLGVTLLALIGLVLTATGIGAVVGLPIAIWGILLARSAFDESGRFVGITNVIKAFFFVTVPLLIGLIVLLISAIS